MAKVNSNRVKVELVDEIGGRLVIVAGPVKDKGFRSKFSIHSGIEGVKTKRGKPQFHGSIADAQKRVDGLVAEAKKNGWTVKAKAPKAAKFDLETIPVAMKKADVPAGAKLVAGKAKKPAKPVKPIADKK